MKIFCCRKICRHILICFLIIFTGLMFISSVFAQDNSEDINPDLAAFNDGNKWALLIGISSYEDARIPGVPYAADAAEELSDILIQHSDYTTSVMSDNQNPESANFPLKEKILVKLELMKNILESSDTLLLYISCQTFSIDGINYILPVDADFEDLSKNAISINEIVDKMSEIEAHTKIIIIDGFRQSLENSVERDFDACFQQSEVFSNSQNLFFVLSSDFGQFSNDYPDQESSCFTHYLLSGLNGEAQSDGSDYITISDLSNYLESSLQEWSFRSSVIQIPVFIPDASQHVIALWNTDIALSDQNHEIQINSSTTVQENLDTDNSPDQANYLEANGVPAEGFALNPEDDTDWFRIDVSEDLSDERIFYLSIHTEGNTDTRLILYGPDQYVEAILWDSDSGEGYNAMINYYIQNNGTYYVAVVPDVDNETGDYSIAASIEQQLGDEYEYDNEPDQANILAIPSSETHSLFPAGDEDWFVIDIDEPDIEDNSVFVTIYTEGNLDTMLYLYGPDSYHELITDDDDSGEDYNAMINAFIVENGRYYINVLPYDSSNAIIDDYIISIEILEDIGDEYEADNSPERANDIIPNEVQQHSIFPASDADWYRFEVQQRSRVIIKTSTDIDTYMTMYGPDNPSYLHSENDDIDYDTGLTNSRLDQILVPGIYFVEIRHYNQTQGTGDYEISLSLIPVDDDQPDSDGNVVEHEGDDYENDNYSYQATVLMPNEVQQHSILPAGDVDWYRLEIQERVRIIIQTASDIDTYMEMYGPNNPNSYYNENDDIDYEAGLLNSQLDLVLEAGTYYVEIRHFNEAEGTGDYEISFAATQVEEIQPDQFEEDNSFSLASEIPTDGREQSHNFYPEGDVDWHTFTITQDEDVTITTFGDSDTVLQLFGPDDSRTLITEDDDGGDNYCSMIRERLEPGTYYIRIIEYGEDDTGDYRISVQRAGVTTN